MSCHFRWRLAVLISTHMIRSSTLFLREGTLCRVPSLLIGGSAISYGRRHPD
ncbi:hypothetical protein BT93_H1878 [Corymbia citriodora subsp. variegata]|nr:hypothetical protein BT93_H1878 [Corymbia citriodora subsp. variegata]